MGQATVDVKIRAALKQLLKKHEMTYRELGVHLKVSEASIKQLMNRGHFTTEKLELISQKFGLTLLEFMEIALTKESGPFPVTIQQEEILMEYPTSIRLLFLLGSGFSLETAKERLQLANSKFQKSLLVLDRAGFIEYLSEKRVIVKARAPFRFNKNGAIERKLRAGYLELVKQQIAHPHQADTYQRSFEMYFSQRLFSQLKAEMGTVVEKYAHLTRIEAELDENQKTFAVTGLVMLKPFDGWGTFLKSY